MPLCELREVRWELTLIGADVQAVKLAVSRAVELTSAPLHAQVVVS